MANVTYGDGVSDENIHIVLQRIANLSNKDIHVHSGDRPAGHFVKGSKPTSLHIARRAADFHFKGMTDLQGFNFIKENMNKIFDQTEAYEVIQHRPGGSTGGPHLHIGRYGIGKNGYRRGYIIFMKDGLELGKLYSVLKVKFTDTNGTPIQPELEVARAQNAGAGTSPTNVLASVGKNGKNSPYDVLKVQNLLNLALMKLTEANIYFQKYNPLTENGLCDEQTIQAITIFQRDVMSWKTPDSRIDPGGRTLQFLYIAAYNPSDAALQNLNRAKTLLKEPEDGTLEWNGVLAWGKHPNVSPAFREKTIQICRELGIKNPSWLMTVMAFESRRLFSSNVPNAAGSSGIGLIQFMKETIDGRTDKKGKFHPGLGAKIGIKYNQLAGMTNVRQLDVVKAYFQQYKNMTEQATKIEDIYFIVLNSKGYGKDANFPLFTGGLEYKQNAGLDKNHDHIVTTGEVSQIIRDMLQEGLNKYPFSKE